MQGTSEVSSAYSIRLLNSNLLAEGIIRRRGKKKDTGKTSERKKIKNRGE